MRGDPNSPQTQPGRSERRGGPMPPDDASSATVKARNDEKERLSRVLANPRLFAEVQDLNHVLWYVRKCSLEKWRISHLHRLELSFGHLSDLYDMRGVRGRFKCFLFWYQSNLLLISALPSPF